MNLNNKRPGRAMKDAHIKHHEANPYGCLHLKLQTILYKQGRYSQMHFNLYLACRMSVPGWVFNESDIRTMTGIHRNIVSAHCRALVQAGILAPAGTTANGSPQYNLDKRKLEAYLKGTKPLDPVRKPIKAQLPALPSLPSDGSPPCHSMIAPLPSDDTLPLSSNGSPPCHPMVAYKEDKKEDPEKKEKKKDTHSRGVCVSECSDSLPDSDKVDQAEVEVRDDPAGHPLPSSFLIPKSAIKRPVVSGDSFPVNCSASTGPSAALVSAMDSKTRGRVDFEAKLSQVLPGLLHSDPEKEYQNRKQAEAMAEEIRKKAEKEQQERANKAYENWKANLIESPSKAKEKKTDLPPSEKVQVLKEAIEVLNVNGDLDEITGFPYRNHITVTKKSLDTALDFFTSNSDISVSEVLSALQHCCFINHHYGKPEKGAFCQHFFAWKAGESLDFFWNNLANVNTYCLESCYGFDGPIIYPASNRRRNGESNSSEPSQIAPKLVRTL